ncbi:MAG: type II secretion system F family protein, partial [Kangiellaceae bacterium]
MFKDTQSNLFNDLATLTDAGIPVLDAAKRVAASHPKVNVWSQVIQSLSKGNRLSVSLSKSGLITRYEQEIIAVSEYAGRLTQGLRSIAESYDKRRVRISKLKSKLYMPFAVLVIAIVVSGILQVSQNPELSILLVIANSIFYLGLAIGTTKIILVLMQKEACFWLNKVKSFENNEWYQMQFQQVVFGALLWHVSSGIDFKAGFARISKLINDKGIQKKLNRASILCGQGLSVSESVHKAELPISSEFKQILITGEQSGRWEDAVKKFLDQNALLLDIRIDNAFEWAPRIYYGLIVLVAISVIF